MSHHRSLYNVRFSTLTENQSAFYPHQPSDGTVPEHPASPSQLMWTFGIFAAASSHTISTLL